MPSNFKTNNKMQLTYFQNGQLVEVENSDTGFDFSTPDGKKLNIKMVNYGDEDNPEWDFEINGNGAFKQLAEDVEEVKPKKKK